MSNAVLKVVMNDGFPEEIEVTDLRSAISEMLKNLPQRAGAIYGLPASGYLELDEQPVMRRAMDGIVLEIGCDAEMEAQIIRDTEPVDFARRPDNRSTIFIWYENKDRADEYRELFRKHREASLVSDDSE